MKILLTGKNGQVGWELQRTLSVLGEVVALGSAELDLADADAILRVVRGIKPDLIVNPAAYTAVDSAESESELAMAINARAPGILAEEARRMGALLLHYSTDYVFDGSKACAYVESDIPNPLNVYGRSKLEGERAVQAVGGRHLIFRTSWVYGLRGRNFLVTMRRLLQEREQVSVVSDQIGAPTWSRWLAEASSQIVLQCQQMGAVSGLYHMTPSGSTSWHGFASVLRLHAQAPAEVLPITAADYVTPALRPYNSCLDGAKLEADFRTYRPDWKHLLDLCLADVPAVR